MPIRKNKFSLLYEPRHTETCLRAYSDSEGPDQTAHPRSLIWGFAVRRQNHLILYRTESKDSEDALDLRRII